VLYRPVVIRSKKDSGSNDAKIIHLYIGGSSVLILAVGMFNCIVQLLVPGHWAEMFNCIVHLLVSDQWAELFNSIVQLLLSGCWAEMFNCIVHSFLTSGQSCLTV
jgi:hypothetical protein